MPELPEVETIKNDLTPEIVGRRFVGVTLLWRGMLHHPSPEEFSRRLKGQTIQEVGRRGKYLLIRLSSGEVLILHLRMSGTLLLQAAPARYDPYTRAVFHLEDGRELCFCDRRKLGVMWLVADEAEVVGKLGPEPLDPGFTPESLSRILDRHSMPIKALLCDQSLLAGIGNMYADEALFLSRLHPLRKASSLSPEEVRRLHQAIQQVLRQGIRNKGASVDTYLRPDGVPGNAQMEFQVAHRGGEPCYQCGTLIQRIPLRGRGTYFCPRCQPRSPETLLTLF
jgi:formamidopyrimidine-DNA glycosylase